MIFAGAEGTLRRPGAPLVISKLPRTSMEEMKVKRTATKTLKVSQEQATRALHVLVSEGKIAAREVYGALKRRENLIRQLRERLAALEKDGPFPMKTAALKRAGRKAARNAKRRVSAARRAAMKAQGRYLGAIRGLSKQARVKIKAIREKSGVTAAIAAAKRVAG